MRSTLPPSIIIPTAPHQWNFESLSVNTHESRGCFFADGVNIVPQPKTPEPPPPHIPPTSHSQTLSLHPSSPSTSNPNPKSLTVHSLQSCIFHANGSLWKIKHPHLKRNTLVNIIPFPFTHQLMVWTGNTALYWFLSKYRQVCSCVDGLMTRDSLFFCKRTSNIYFLRLLPPRLLPRLCHPRPRGRHSRWTGYFLTSLPKMGTPMTSRWWWSTSKASSGRNRVSVPRNLIT